MLRAVCRPFAVRFAVSAVVLVSPLSVLADDDDNRRLEAVPSVFVGTAENCGVAGSNIVTSAWLGGMGLPDNGGQNTSLLDLATNPNKRDPHLGLLLSKNGPTPDCSAAGAVIRGFRPGGTITELGFDYRKGGHCGAGAPRFNVTDEAGVTYFFGCIYGVPTPAPQDLQWERVRFLVPTPGNEGFVFGVTRVQSIEIVFDEGTDTPTLEDPQGVGLAVLDNIDVNGRLITRGRGIEPNPRERNND
jgi:hypothetical protein